MSRMVSLSAVVPLSFQLRLQPTPYQANRFFFKEEREFKEGGQRFFPFAAGSQTVAPIGGGQPTAGRQPGIKAIHIRTEFV